MVGAILTQQTAWKNVERAIRNLKNEELLLPSKLYNVPEKELAGLIRPAGFYNIKAKRLKLFVQFFIEEFHGNILEMKNVNLSELRVRLLSVYGVGMETADSILLYALNKPIFVVDAYTKRIVYRAGISTDFSYEEIRKMFEEALEEKEFVNEVSNNCPVAYCDTVYIFQEMHALIVAEGKAFCKKKPFCGECPVKSICERRGVL